MILAVVAAGCATAAPPDTTPVPTLTLAPVTPVTVDLGDDEQLAALGAPRPGGVRWLRPVTGSELAGTTRSVDAAELVLVDDALRLLPDRLGPLPRLVVRSPTPPVGTGRSDPSAVAVGPDIHLFDATFQRDGLPVGPVGLARILAHEIVHIAQFATLDPVHVGGVLEHGGRVDLTRSTLVDDFVAATGWNVADDAWVAPDAVSTPYGGTHPTEDMAEAVSLVVTGLGDLIPTAQRTWVETWLEAGTDQLAAGMPWAPAGSAEVLSTSPLWDDTAIERIGGETLEHLVYRTDGTVDDLPATLEARLRDRAMTGSLGRVDDDRIARWAGRFDRGDGFVWWVEIWDFTQAPGFSEGPDTPVISYTLVRLP